MRSQWFEFKESAVELRTSGMSIKSIEKKLGIPRSTLSGWLKDVEISDGHRAQLSRDQLNALKRARIKAAESHSANKSLRILKAKSEAHKIIENLEINSELLDVALAMLYLGEGKKRDGPTSIANSDPMILKFILSVLQINYGISPNTIRCELHLRWDQNEEDIKRYWSRELGVPINRFGSVSFDTRSKNKPTYEKYKGVCVLQIGNVQIQRKLIYLYTTLCDKVALLNRGD